MGRIAGLLRPGALVTLLLRHGPVPVGRRMFEVSAEETRAAGQHGLTTSMTASAPPYWPAARCGGAWLALRAPA